MNFRDAVIEETNVTTTENGMKAFKSSMNKNVDLFFAVGASRGKDIAPAFREALNENPELALRIALWTRDAREGAGERQTFRNILKFLENHQDSALIHIIPKIPELGRWDDLLVFQSTVWKQAAYDVIARGLQEANGLCAKWMPRQGPIAKEIREYFGLTPKQWRKGLVQLSNTVEQRMCAKDWSNITFEHVPSVASARYQKAFTRNCGQRYVDYRQALANGSTKINAKAIFPYDVIRGGKNGDKVVAQAQWDSLPNFIHENARIMPIVDVSDSMTWFKVAGNLLPLDVAVSLGIYASEKQSGKFKNVMMTFDTNPKVFHLSGSVFDKVRQVQNAGVGGSTNIEAAFAKILEIAVKHNVPENEMPTHILIFSDMQFNPVFMRDRNSTAQEMIESKFKAAGYEIPKVIYWNLNARGDNIPVKFDKDGVGLVSGFSPTLMKQVLSMGDVSPESIMLDTVMQDRYNLA